MGAAGVSLGTEGVTAWAAEVEVAAIPFVGEEPSILGSGPLGFGVSLTGSAAAAGASGATLSLVAVGSVAETVTIVCLEG